MPVIRLTRVVLPAPFGPMMPRISPASTAKDRKSTRLNSSHSQISYAVFCLKKKKNDFIGNPSPLPLSARDTPRLAEPRLHLPSSEPAINSRTQGRCYD